MPKQFGSQVDLQKIPLLNLVVHSSTSEPTTPVNGQLWFDTTAGVMKVREGGIWLLVANAAGGSTPTGPAGGDLTGSSYPNPVIAANAVTTAKINDLAVTNGKLAANAVTTDKIANSTITSLDIDPLHVDGAAATPGMRTLGFTAAKAMPGDADLDQLGQPTSSIGMNYQRFYNLGQPTSANDAATKAYVDSLAQGLDVHPSVKAASVGNHGTYAPGTGGVSSTGTAQMTVMPNTIDGVSLATNSRVLLKDQTDQKSNGIWQVTTLGTGSNGVWMRPTDFNYIFDSPAGTGAQTATAGAFVFVESGTVNADTGWLLTTDAPVIDGASATNLAWTQFSGAGTFNAGAGLTKTGNTLDVIGTTNRVTVAADAVDIASNYVGQASITTVGTITSGAWDGTDIPITAGGTGAGTVNLARQNLVVPTYVTGLMVALSAGVQASFTHNIGTMTPLVQFQLVATDRDIELDWKVIDLYSIGVTADIAYAASAIRVTVHG